MSPVKKISTTVMLSAPLLERVDRHLQSPVSGLKSKRALIEQAITNYLDREEIVVAKLEKELSMINERLR